jgi:hypothetical protein
MQDVGEVHALEEVPDDGVSADAMNAQGSDVMANLPMENARTLPDIHIYAICISDTWEQSQENEWFGAYARWSLGEQSSWTNWRKPTC